MIKRNPRGRTFLWLVPILGVLMILVVGTIQYFQGRTAVSRLEAELAGFASRDPERSSTNPLTPPTPAEKTISHIVPAMRALLRPVDELEADLGSVNLDGVVTEQNRRVSSPPAPGEAWPTEFAVADFVRQSKALIQSLKLISDQDVSLPGPYLAIDDRYRFAGIEDLRVLHRGITLRFDFAVYHQQADDAVRMAKLAMKLHGWKIQPHGVLAASRSLGLSQYMVFRIGETLRLGMFDAEQLGELRQALHGTETTSSQWNETILAELEMIRQRDRLRVAGGFDLITNPWLPSPQVKLATLRRMKQALRDDAATDLAASSQSPDPSDRRDSKSLRQQSLDRWGDPSLIALPSAHSSRTEPEAFAVEEYRSRTRRFHTAVGFSKAALAIAEYRDREGVFPKSLEALGPMGLQAGERVQWDGTPFEYYFDPSGGPATLAMQTRDPRSIYALSNPRYKFIKRIIRIAAPGLVDNQSKSAD